MIETLQREDLNPIEEAEGYRVLTESDDANENGLIIAASQDDFEAFILGDAPSKAEKALIASAPSRGR